MLYEQLVKKFSHGSIDDDSIAFQESVWYTLSLKLFVTECSLL